MGGWLGAAAVGSHARQQVGFAQLAAIVVGATSMHARLASMAASQLPLLRCATHHCARRRPLSPTSVSRICGRYRWPCWTACSLCPPPS